MEQIEQLIKRRIADRVADREHSPQIDNPSSPEIPPSQPENAIAATFMYTRGRLREEIQNLSRRSSVNLVIGVMVTMAATAILVYLVSREHAEFSSVKSLLSFYIPRITTVILIETFAYFFLKLYRQNLEEIKYYQNELTTLAAQEIAWQASIVANMPEATSAVIQQLAKSDRNGRSLPDAQSRPNSDLGGLLEILQTVSKLIASSAKAKE
jgi:predicted PurR-regulated permease PerM